MYFGKCLRATPLRELGAAQGRGRGRDMSQLRWRPQLIGREPWSRRGSSELCHVEERGGTSVPLHPSVIVYASREGQNFSEATPGG